MNCTRIAAAFLLLASGLAAAQDAQEAGEADKARPDPQARFWEARRVMLEGDDPAGAAELFRTLVGEFPKSDRADDSLYWMGRCCLRVKDREPDAVVAFNRLIREYPESPFLDDAARELFRLGDTTGVPDLLKRIAGDGPGKAKEMAARALVELGRVEGADYLEEMDLAPRPVPRPSAEGKTVGDEVKKLEAEVIRLRKQVEEAIALLEKLLADRLKAAETKNASDDLKDGDD